MRKAMMTTVLVLSLLAIAAVVPSSTWRIADTGQATTAMADTDGVIPAYMSDSEGAIPPDMS